jgi:hypothetical protein
MARGRALTIAAALALAAAVGGAAAVVVATWPQPQAAATPGRPVWSEAAWPFPIDPWGTGRAFRCAAADCGAEVTLYVRAKIGFCNCTTGVADDDELDRIGDVYLLSRQSAALGPGRAIEVHWMRGRSRVYALGGRGTSVKSALSIAFNDRCDVIVATAAVDGAEPAAREVAVLAFLNGDLVLRWAETTLGL